MASGIVQSAQRLGYVLDDRGSIPGRERDFSLFYRV
jgi:hypothetical protein